MKKAFPLFVLIIIVFFLPHVRADTESLYVNSYTGNLANWDERNEPSPYLADESTGFVHEVKSSGATEGYFGFTNPIGTGTVNSVTVYIECYGQDTNDKIIIYVDCSDGSGWVNEGEVIVNQLSYDWEILSLSTRLDSWPDIQNAQIYLFYQGVGGGDDIFARRAYLYIDYTPAGDEYSRELSQQISYNGMSYRNCNLERDTSQGLTISGNSYRIWSLTRIITQSFSLSISAISDLIQNILVQLSQGINIESNSFLMGGFKRIVSEDFSFSSGIEKALNAIRNPVQSITASVEALRSWSLTRNIVQIINLSTTTNAISNYIRTVQQGLSFTIESFTKMIVGGGEAFYRTVTMGMDFTTNSIRKLNLKRILGQIISVESTGNTDGYESDPDDPPSYGIILIPTDSTNEPPETSSNSSILELTILIGSTILLIIKKRIRRS